MRPARVDPFGERMMTGRRSSGESSAELRVGNRAMFRSGRRGHGATIGRKGGKRRARVLRVRKRNGLGRRDPAFRELDKARRLGWASDVIGVVNNHEGGDADAEKLAEHRHALLA